MGEFRKHVDISGMTFSFLTVLGRDGSRGRTALWLCRCTCGKHVKHDARKLKSGRVKSCGCKLRELLSRPVSHGMTYSREYNTWKHMLQRCRNPNTSAYRYYGGRGIKVCPEWASSFERFYGDMGPCPEGLEIERINNDGDYEPENCEWASRKEQCNNYRRNVRHIVMGKWNMTTTQLARAVNLPLGTVRHWLKHMTPDEVFCHPRARVYQISASTPDEAVAAVLAAAGETR